MNLAVIIAARLDSKRLPGKALLEISGKPVLGFLLERLKQSEFCDDLIIATTDRAIDDPIAKLTDDYGVRCFRGNSTDLIDRYVKAMGYFDIEVAARVTADCPFVNGDILSIAINKYKSLSKSQKRTLVTTKGIMPVGLDVEVFDKTSLEFLQTRIDLSAQHREHLTLYMYDHPELFNIVKVPAHIKSSFQSECYTLDTQEDLEHLRIIAQKVETLDASIRIMTAIK